MKTTIPALLLLAVAACGASDGGGAETRSFEVERTSSGGPVTLIVRLSRPEIGLEESLVLEEEVRAEEGFTAELPEFVPEEFEGFGVVDVDEDPAREDGGVTVLRRRLTLEPERSGALTVPVRESSFHRTGEDAENVVASEAIEVAVRPIEDAASMALPDARSVIRPEDVDAEEGMSRWWLLLLLVPAGVLALVLRRRRAKPGPPPRPAHELAWEALRRLAAADLLGKGEVERFFVVLSAILREYVERRYGVRAPERTTREFLAEASDHPGLADHHTPLGTFLALADRVKFARFDPEEASIQEAFDVTRGFIEATQEANGGAAATRGGGGA